jgi:chemotaxis family two-component system response regulator Rcp1
MNNNRNCMDILLVEDNPADIRLTMEAFRESRHEHCVHVVTDGTQAIAYLRHHGMYKNAPTPDLILLDLNLPQKNGREVLSEIKSDDTLRHIPVVILTTSRTEEDVLQTYQLHGNCYITKPADLDEFFHLIQKIQDFWFQVARIPERR